MLRFVGDSEVLPHEPAGSGGGGKLAAALIVVSVVASAVIDHPFERRGLTAEEGFIEICNNYHCQVSSH